MELGEKIKELRNQHQFTQEDLANKLHITRQTISKWEANKSIPNIIQIKELCQIFEISIDEFMSNATYHKKTKKYYYVLFIIGLLIYTLPYLGIVFSTFTNSLSTQFLMASYRIFFEKIGYAFMLAGIGFFIFEKYK